MLSKNKIKYLSSLSEKKGRFENKAFMVEGEKIVFEALSSGFTVKALMGTPKMLQLLKLPITPQTEIIEISETEATKISTQKTPQGIFAEILIPDDYYTEKPCDINDLTIALHDIQDPGNLGTIIRTADWFGVKRIICSKSTADVLNPKVLQSTMGAAFRVRLNYVELAQTLMNLRDENKDLPIFAAVLGGEDLYKTIVPQKGIIMMGNESKGLSDELIKLATHKITIPRLGNPLSSGESLNVAVATAIILSEMRRKTTVAQ